MRPGDLFYNKRDGIYYEDNPRFSNFLGFAESACYKACETTGDCSKFGTGLSRRCTDCKNACKAAGGLGALLNEGGNGGDRNGNGGNGGDGNGGNGKGPEIKTILLWVGVFFLIIALIIGGAYAIKKIRS